MKKILNEDIHILELKPEIEQELKQKCGQSPRFVHKI